MVKKRIPALLMIILLLLCTGCHKPTLKDYKLFRSSPLGFSIEYPDFWNKASDNSENTAVFASPAEGYSDTTLDNLAVQRFVLDMEGEDAYNRFLKGYVENLNQIRKKFKIVSETDTTLAGKDAYQIVYECVTDDDRELRQMQIFTQHKGYVYVLTYTAEFSSYSYFLTYVEKMISTFKFI